MAKYKLDWVEKKNEDWIVASLASGEKEVSINRKSKKGEVFPNFDSLTSGMEIEGELWTSPANKIYLFPPKQNPMYPRPAGLGGIAKAQERKAEYIKEAQDKKELSIAYFNSCNLAVDSMNGEWDETTFVTRRDFFLQEWMKWDAKPENEKRIPF